MSPPATAFDRLDPTRLHDHFRQCARACSPLHRLQCAGEALDAFMAPRFVTTLALMGVVLLLTLALPA